jgi:hypothetical protein
MPSQTSHSSTGQKIAHQQGNCCSNNTSRGIAGGVGEMDPFLPKAQESINEGFNDVIGGVGVEMSGKYTEQEHVLHPIAEFWGKVEASQINSSAFGYNARQFQGVRIETIHV